MELKLLEKQIAAAEDLCCEIAASYDFSDDPTAQNLICKLDDAIVEMRRVMKEDECLESKASCDAYSKMLHAAYWVEVYFRGEDLD